MRETPKNMDAYELQHCLRNNNLEKFKNLVNKGNVGQQVTLNRNTQSILHIVCRARYNLKDSPTFVEYLINECDVNIDALDSFQLTPLHQSVCDSYLHQSNSACVLTLLKLKANVNSRAHEYADTPLERVMSCLYSSSTLSLMWTLVEFGAKTYQQEYDGSHSKSLFSLKSIMNGRTFARRAALTLVGIRKYRRSQVLNLQDSNISIMIAKIVWESRRNFEDWAPK